jgi:dTDP-D-glucose 4,6-dehydratase
MRILVTGGAGFIGDPRFAFVRGDICDRDAVEAALHKFRPHWIMNLAAESHVARSIDGPARSSISE